MGAKGTKNGQRKKYILDDGQVVDVFMVATEVNCSLSLATARLNTSSDPEYIFMEKGTKIKGGQKYCQLEKKRKAMKSEKHIALGRKRKSEKHYRDGSLKLLYDPMMRLILKTI